MARNTPNGPHADVAERFAFLLEALDLDRAGFADAVDGAITARSLFAVLSGDRRPSRALAVLIERTFGFRADHLLHGEGAMWVGSTDGEDGDSAVGRTEVERRLLAFGRRSVDNARLLADELERAEAWEQMWGRAQALLSDLEHTARQDEPSDYPVAATTTLQACWAMADAFSTWTDANDRRRVVQLTRLFVRRFLVQVPSELEQRGALTEPEASALRDRAGVVLDQLATDSEGLETQVRRAAERIDELTDATATASELTGVAQQLEQLLGRIGANLPLPG